MCRLKLTSMLIVCLLISAFLPSCGNKAEEDPHDIVPYEIRKDWDSTITGLTKPPNHDDTEYLTESKKAVSSITAYHVPVSVEDMIEKSDLIVRGKVIGFDFVNVRHITEEHFLIRTDYYIELIDIPKGSASTDENGFIRVRIPGGESDSEIEINESLQLEISNEYVFALIKPTPELDMYHTDEEGYYYILETYTGLLTKDPGEKYRIFDLTTKDAFYPYIYSEINDEPIEYDELINEIKTFESEYADKNFNHR